MTTNWETVTHEGETYKVLNDHAGNLTVTEWREQLEEYVEHMCDKTGIELLKGTAPSCTPGILIDKTTLVGTTGEQRLWQWRGQRRQSRRAPYK